MGSGIELMQPLDFSLKNLEVNRYICALSAVLAAAFTTLSCRQKWWQLHFCDTLRPSNSSKHLFHCPVQSARTSVRGSRFRFGWRKRMRFIYSNILFITLVISLKTTFRHIPVVLQYNIIYVFKWHFQNAVVLCSPYDLCRIKTGTNYFSCKIASFSILSKHSCNMNSLF